MISLSELKKLYAEKDKMHGFSHIVKIKQDVALLRKDYKRIDENLLWFLILFHGLKNYVAKNKQKFPKRFIISLMRHSKKPIKIEEKIVFDANMLDNVGKSGIKKALHIGREIGRTKKETFAYLKSVLKETKFYTKKGKELGKMRINEMRRLIAQ